MTDERDKGCRERYGPYEAFTAFTRIIGHELRNPLSVIQNDLTYFQNLLPPGECRTSLSKCSFISELLGKTKMPEVSDIGEVSLPGILTGLICCRPDFILEPYPSEACETLGCEGVITFCLDRILEIAAFTREENSVCNLSIATNPSHYQLTLDYSLNPAIECPEETGTCSNFSGFCCNLLGLNILDAPLADVALHALGWKTIINLRPGTRDLQVSLEIPK